MTAPMKVVNHLEKKHVLQDFDIYQSVPIDIGTLAHTNRTIYHFYPLSHSNNCLHIKFSYLKIKSLGNLRQTNLTRNRVERSCYAVCIQIQPVSQRKNDLFHFQGIRDLGLKILTGTKYKTNLL